MTETSKQVSSLGAAELAPIPRFIQSQLDYPPIGPNESAAEFRSLFKELADHAQAVGRSAAEYVMLIQATLLTFRCVALERIRSSIIQHMRPEAVVALIRLANGEIERNSAAFFEVNVRRREYFATKEGTAKIEAELAGVGYPSNAVDIEAFQLALPSLAMIDRQINVAQKQLMAFLKEIDRRDARRAEELSKAAIAAIVRAQTGTVEKPEAS